MISMPTVCVAYEIFCEEQKPQITPSYSEFCDIVTTPEYMNSLGLYMVSVMGYKSEHWNGLINYLNDLTPEEYAKEVKTGWGNRPVPQPKIMVEEGQ